MLTLHHVAVFGYRVLLRLYPRAFREQFAADMLRDFVEAGAETLAARGWRAALSQAGRAYADGVVSLAREWGRDTTVVIGTLSVCATAALFIAPVLPPLPDVRRPPARPLSFDELSLVLVILGLVFMIAIVIALAGSVVTTQSRRVTRRADTRWASRRLER